VATAEKLVPTSALTPSSKRDSRGILLEKGSNEFVFAVVGHVGSGTSMVAKTLQQLLRESTVNGQTFDVEILKARDVIEDWAQKQKKQLPPKTGNKLIAHVKTLQDYGDEMRAEKMINGTQDHAAVARGLVLRIRQCRAIKVGIPLDSSGEIMPDGKPRAYILDCLRHPAEVNMLSSLLKKASDRVIAGAARDFSHPKANKKRDSISHHYPE
jgi:energy-coupling factor transporter ATP-binding protein EcfA2